MKRIFLQILAAWLSVLPLLAQVNPAPSVPYDPGEYNRLMQKSRNLKKTGWWMLGGGTVLVCGSMLWFTGEAASNVLQWEDPDVGDGPTIMAAVGLISMAGSIPVFIGAGNAKKKAQLVAGPEPLTLGWRTGKQPVMPALGLKVPIGR
jgi:hypothetical protein